MRACFLVTLTLPALALCLPSLKEREIEKPRKLKILMSNDDGFASLNSRALIKELQGAGHQVKFVAPAGEQSVMGGAIRWASGVTVKTSQFGLLSPDLPSYGPAKRVISKAIYGDKVSSEDEAALKEDQAVDDVTWYYDGTPAAATLVGIAENEDHGNLNSQQSSYDLFISGPNYGPNMGSYIHGVSGTVGAARIAIAHGIPAIAVSGAGYIKPKTKEELKDKSQQEMSQKIARLTMKAITPLIENTNQGERVLPYGYGVNINIPDLPWIEKHNLAQPQVVLTRESGGARMDQAIRRIESSPIAAKRLDGRLDVIRRTMSDVSDTIYKDWDEQKRDAFNANLEADYPKDRYPMYSLRAIQSFHTGPNVCYSGACGKDHGETSRSDPEFDDILRGEASVLKGFDISVTIFTIDATAPENRWTDAVREKLNGVAKSPREKVTEDGSSTGHYIFNDVTANAEGRFLGYWPQKKTYGLGGEDLGYGS